MDLVLSLRFDVIELSGKRRIYDLSCRQKRRKWENQWQAIVCLPRKMAAYLKGVDNWSFLRSSEARTIASSCIIALLNNIYVNRAHRTAVKMKRVYK